MCFKSCLVGLAVFLVASFILVGLPIIVYNAVVKPRNPTFSLDHASVTAFNLTSEGGHLTAFFDVVIRANNPNHKLKLRYSDIRVSIFKDKQNLAEDLVPAFSQSKRNVTFVKAEPIALNVTLKKGPAFDLQLESGIGYIEFDVFMTATLNQNNLEVNCRHAMVNLTAPPLIDANNSPTFDSNNNINNEHNFRRVGCSVYIYSDSDDNY